MFLFFYTLIDWSLLHIYASKHNWKHNIAMAIFFISWEIANFFLRVCVLYNLTSSI
jgi:hypothetical protein